MKADFGHMGSASNVVSRVNMAENLGEGNVVQVRIFKKYHLVLRFLLWKILTNIYSLNQSIFQTSQLALSWILIFCCVCVHSGVWYKVACCHDHVLTLCSEIIENVFINFKDRAVLLEYNEMKKVFSLDILVKSENKTRIVQDIFNVSIDNSSMVLFQRFDKDWEEFIDCAIDDIKHKDKIKVVIIRKQENHDYGNLQVISILTW